MTDPIKFSRRRLGKAALAGASLLGAPAPLRQAFAQAPANLKVALRSEEHTSELQSPC